MNARRRAFGRSGPGRAAATESRVIIYVATFPRSGNNLLQRTLRQNFERMTSQIAGKPWSVEAYQEALDRGGTGWRIQAGADLKSDWPETLHWDARTAVYSWKQGPARRFILPSPIDYFTPELRTALAAEDELFLFKTHHLPFDDFLEGERVIQVVRHPGASIWSLFRMVVDSHLPVTGAKLFHRPPPTLSQIIERDSLFGNWSEYHRAWSVAAEQLGSRFLLMRFEDLVGSREQSLARIGGFLDLELACSDPVPFEAYRNRWPHMDLRGTSEGFEQYYTAQQLERLWRTHAEAAETFGYAAPNFDAAADDAHLRRLEDVIETAWTRGRQCEDELAALRSQLRTLQAAQQAKDGAA